MSSKVEVLGENNHSNKITVQQQTSSLQELKSQIVILLTFSGVLLLFMMYITVCVFDKQSLLKADYQLASIEKKTESFQSWYLLSNGMSCALLMTLNLIVLFALYFSLTYSSSLGDTSYVHNWKKVFQFVILICYILFFGGVYLLYGLAASAIQIVYPYYCDHDVKGHIGDGVMREDTIKCATDKYGEEGLFKTLTLKYRSTLFALIPILTLIIVVIQVVLNIMWDKKPGNKKNPNKTLKMWLNSLNLDRNYEIIFANHNVSFRQLKKIADNQQLLFTTLQSLGVNQIGDILKIIESVNSLKDLSDVESQNGGNFGRNKRNSEDEYDGYGNMVTGTKILPEKSKIELEGNEVKGSTQHESPESSNQNKGVLDKVGDQQKLAELQKLVDKQPKKKK